MILVLCGGSVGV